jgi:hypothetical protein
MGIVIKDNYVRFSDNNWFVGNAETAQTGSIGRKATPFLGVSKLEVKDHLPPSKLNGAVRVLGPYEIDTKLSSKSDFNTAVSGNFEVIGLRVSGGAVFDALTTGKLKFVELFVEEEDMVSAVNQSPAILDHLASYGADARIVHRELLVLESELAHRVTAGSKVEVSAEAAGISLTIGGGSSASSSVELRVAPFNCMAYLLLNFSWNSNKTRIENPRTDAHGLQ